MYLPLLSFAELEDAILVLKSKTKYIIVIPWENWGVIIEENFYSLSSYRPTHAHITRRVMLLF